MNDSNKRWFLTGIGGVVNGREFLIVGQEISLGRTPENDIVIPGENVSRRHAVIFMRGDQCWIRDEKSKNGTFLNEERITESPLQENDILRVGKCRFRVGLEQPTRDDSNASDSKLAGVMERVRLIHFPHPSIWISWFRTTWADPIGRRRVILWSVASVALMYTVCSIIPHKKSFSPPTSSSGQGFTPPLPFQRSVSDDEVLAWRSQAQAALISDDFHSAVLSLRKVVAARPTDSSAQSQLVRAENRLHGQISEFYENGAREYEKLYYDRAIREWRKVIALAEGLIPEMVKQAQEKIRDAQAKLAKRKPQKRTGTP